MTETNIRSNPLNAPVSTKRLLGAHGTGEKPFEITLLSDDRCICPAPSCARTVRQRGLAMHVRGRGCRGDFTPDQLHALNTVSSAAKARHEKRRRDMLRALHAANPDKTSSEAMEATRRAAAEAEGVKVRMRRLHRLRPRRETPRYMIGSAPSAAAAAATADPRYAGQVTIADYANHLAARFLREIDGVATSQSQQEKEEASRVAMTNEFPEAIVLTSSPAPWTPAVQNALLGSQAPPKSSRRQSLPRGMSRPRPKTAWYGPQGQGVYTAPPTHDAVESWTALMAARSRATAQATGDGSGSEETGNPSSGTRIWTHPAGVFFQPHAAGASAAPHTVCWTFVADTPPAATPSAQRSSPAGSGAAAVVAGAGAGATAAAATAVATGTAAAAAAALPGAEAPAPAAAAATAAVHGTGGGGVAVLGPGAAASPGAAGVVGAVVSAAPAADASASATASLPSPAAAPASGAAAVAGGAAPVHGGAAPADK